MLSCTNMSLPNMNRERKIRTIDSSEWKVARMPSKVVVQSQAHLATHVSKVSHSAALRDTIPEGNQCVCMYDYRHSVYLYMCVWYSCAFD